MLVFRADPYQSPGLGGSRSSSGNACTENTRNSPVDLKLNKIKPLVLTDTYVTMCGEASWEVLNESAAEWSTPEQIMFQSSRAPHLCLSPYLSGQKMQYLATTNYLLLLGM